MNTVVNAWLRLDRAISETSKPNRANTRLIRSSEHSRAGARRVFNPRYKTLHDDSENEVYLTMVDAIQNESKLSMRDQQPISKTMMTQQSTDIGHLMKTSGSVVQSIKRIMTLKAYDRQEGIATQQLKMYHQ
jgi:hypothetical protein